MSVSFRAGVNTAGISQARGRNGFLRCLPGAKGRKPQFFWGKDVMGNSQSRFLRFLLIALACALFSVFASQAFAAPGINRQINYQGRLLTSGGQSVADGTYLLRLSLYDAGSSGNRLWTASGSTSTPAAVNVTVTNGLFSIQLGDVAAGQNPFDFDFYQDSIYLGVTVASDTEMLPRKRLTSVPYAFVAETLQGQYASSAVATTGGNLFTLQQTSSSAATGDRTALFIRTSGTSNLFDYLIKGNSGADVFTVSRQGNIVANDLSIRNVTSSGYVSTTRLVVTNNGSSADPAIWFGTSTVGLYRVADAVAVRGDGINIRNTADNATLFSASFGSNSINFGANAVPLANAVYDIGSPTLSFNNIYASGTHSTLRGLNFTNATGTNATTTNFFTSNLFFENGTSTSWLGFNTASGTNLFVQGQSVCLQNGTNCPATSSGGSNYWSYNITNDTLYPGTSTVDVLLGGATVSSTPFRFLTQTTSSRFFVGSHGSSTDIVVGGPTSTITNSLFQLNGGSIFALNNIGAASSIYTNAAFIAGNTLFGGGFINNTNGSLVVSSTSNVIFGMNDNLGVGTSTPSEKFTVVGTVQNTLVAGQTYSSTTSIGIVDPRDMDIVGRYAYVANRASSTIQIYDLQDPRGATSVGMYMTGSDPQAITVRWPYAYVAANGTANFQIIDISNAFAPVGISTTTNGGGNIQWLTVSGKYLYTLNTSVVRIYDISDPAAPIFIRSITAAARRLVIQGSYGYLVNGSGTFTVLDLHDPLTASIAGTTSTISTNAYDVAIQGRYAYLATTDGMRIYDVAIPTAPRHLSTSSFSVGTNAQIIASGRYVYMLGDTSLGVFDVSSSTNPLLLTSQVVGITITDAKLNGKYLTYLDDTKDLLTVLDMKGVETNALLAHSAEVGSLTVDTSAIIQNQLTVGTSIMVGYGGIFSTGALAIYATNTSSTISGPLLVQGQRVCLQNSTNCPTASLVDEWTYNATADTLSPATTTNDVLIGGALNANAPFRFLTQTTSSRLFVGAHGSSTDIVVGGTTSTITNTMFQLNGGSIFALSNIGAASSVYSNGAFMASTTLLARGVLNNTGGNLNVSSSGNIILSPNGNVGIGIGVGTPTEKLVVGGGIVNLHPDDFGYSTTSQIVTNTNPRGLDVFGRYAYVANNGSDTLQIIDIQDPRGATTVSSFLTVNAPTNVEVHWPYAYVNSASELQIIDISNPKAALGLSTTTLSVTSVVVSGKYLYALGSSAGTGIRVYDISNPTAPLLIKAFPNNLADRGVIQGGYLYTVYPLGLNLTIMDIRDPANATVASSSLPIGGVIPRDVAVQGRYVYISAQNNFFVIDVGNPANPVQVGNSSVSNDQGNLVVSGRYAYRFATNSMRIFDISSSTAPTAVSLSVFPTTVQRGKVVGRYAYYIVDGTPDSLNIVDMKGIETSSILAHQAQLGALAVDTNAYIQNQLYVGTSFTVGMGGIFSAGALAVSATNTTSTFGGAITVQGQRVCLENGLGCPTGTTPDDWVYNATDNTLATGTSTVDVLIGGASAANAPFRFLTQTTSSRLFVGANGSSTDIVVGGTTSTITNSAFQLNGGSIFASGSIAASSSIFTNGSLFVSGTIRFANASGSALDVNNVTQTTLKSTVSVTSGANGVHVSGRYAYVAGNDAASGFRIVDISDPAFPRQTTSVNTGLNVHDVFVAGQYAYLANSTAGLKIYDVSNPSAPSSVGTFLANGGSVVTDVFVVGKYAYTISSDALYVVDISDPATPTSVSSLAVGSGFHQIVVQGKYAYIADDTAGSKIIDISDPTRPVVISTIPALGTHYGIDVSGRYAYITERTDGIRIYDISNPASPVLQSSLETMGNAFGIQVAGKYAYVNDQDSFLVIDVSSSTRPVNVATSTISGGSYLAVAGKYAYVAVASGLSIFDLQGADISTAHIGSLWTNDIFVLDSIDIGNNAVVRNSLNVGGGGIMTDGPISAPVLDVGAVQRMSVVGTASIPSGDTAGEVTVVGRYAYVGTTSSSLRIIDVSNPAAPTSVGTLPNASSSLALTVSGKYAYILENNSPNFTLRIADISNPSAPTTTATLNGFSAPSSIVISGKYAYVADVGTMRVVDISNPRNPKIVASYPSADQMRELYFQAPYIYSASLGTDLEIIDISNPLSPTSVGAFAAAGSSTQDVIVNGRYAYVAYGAEGIKVIDVRNPASPSVVSSLTISGSIIFALDLVGKYLIAADINGSLIAINVEDPANPRIVSRLTSSMTLPSDVQVSGKYAYVTDFRAGLRIVDLQGAEIAAANIGTLQVGDLDVLDSLEVGNMVSIRNGLNVGQGGILTSGNIAAGSLTVDSFENATTVSVYSDGTNDNAYASLSVSGKYVYLGSGNDISIIDVSNPSAPSSVDATLSTGFQDIQVVGRYAYSLNIGSPGTIRVYNVGDSSNPFLVSSVTLTNPVGLHVVGPYAYVGDLTSGLRIVDIADPRSPSSVASNGSATNGSSSNVYVHGDYAYTTDPAADVLRVIDISSSTRPVQYGTVSLSDPRDVEVQGRYAYVANGTAGFAVVDVSDPADPIVRGTAALSGNATSTVVAGHYAYVALGTSGIGIVDISNPYAPTSVRRIMPPSQGGTVNCLDVAVVGKYIYAACAGNTDLVIIDIGGIDAQNGKIASLEADQFVSNGDADFGNNVSIRNALNVGPGGVLVDGTIGARGIQAIRNDASSGTAGLFVKSYGASVGGPDFAVGVAGYVSGTNAVVNDFPLIRSLGSSVTAIAAGGYFVNGYADSITRPAFGSVHVSTASTTGAGAALLAYRNCDQVSTADIVKFMTREDSSRFRVTCDGVIHADNGTVATPGDYAEYFPTADSSITYGEVVAMDADTASSVKRAMATDRDRVLGVVSQHPVLLGNAGPDEAFVDHPFYKPIGLLGQLPVKASNENGVIRAGDKLMAGNDGYAVKSSGVGMILGQAMSHLETATGSVMLYISPTWSADGIFEAASGTTNIRSQGIATATSTAFSSSGMTFQGSAWNASSNTAFTSSFTLVNNVISASSSLFSVNGTNGNALLTISDVGDVTVAGDLTVGHRLFLGSKQGGSGSTSTYIFVDDTQAPSSTYIATNADGWSTSSTYDYAERFPSVETLAAGDLVTTDPTDVNHVKRTGTVNDIVLGIVSTKPGFITGAYSSGTYPIALAGRVPTRVSTANGAILAGDQLAPSDVPGVAVKAVNSGPVVGVALESYDAPTEGKISVFVQPGWKGGEILGGSSDGPSTIIYQTQTFDPGVSPRAGMARLAAGATSVNVAFPSLNAYPLVTITPYGIPTGKWGLMDVNDHGFTITLSNPETFDLVFAWKAEPSQEGAVMSFSDGTMAPYDPLTGQSLGGMASTSSTSSTQPIPPDQPVPTSTASGTEPGG